MPKEKVYHDDCVYWLHNITNIVIPNVKYVIDWTVIH